LSDHAPSEKLHPGTQRAEEERFGARRSESPGGQRFRRGPVAADDENSTSGTTSTPSGARRSILVVVPSPEGGAPGGRREASRGGQPGRTWPGSGLRKDRLARGGRFGGKGSTVRSVAGRFRLNRSAQVGWARRRGAGRQRPEPTHRGRSGRVARREKVSPLSRVRGWAARSCPVVARV